MDVVGGTTAVGSIATAVAVLVAFFELRLQRIVARTQFDELSKEYRQLIKPEVAPALFRGAAGDLDPGKLYAAVFLELRLLVDSNFFDPHDWTPRGFRRWFPQQHTATVQEASVRLEHLMEPGDRRYWRELRKKPAATH